MHNFAIFGFFPLLNSYMFQHSGHLQGAYTNISLKHRAVNSLQKTYFFVMSVVQVLVIFIYIKYKTELLIG